MNEMQSMFPDASHLLRGLVWGWAWPFLPEAACLICRAFSTQERGSAPLPFTSSQGLPVCPPVISWKSQLRPGLPACHCHAVPALLKHCGSGWLQAPGD